LVTLDDARFWRWVCVGFGFCRWGLRLGSKRSQSLMMALIPLHDRLGIPLRTLQGGVRLRYYLIPDFGRMLEKGLGEVLFCRFGQPSHPVSAGQHGDLRSYLGGCDVCWAKR
jgi:NSS family neurotransmitter:Na+ symporter